MSDECVHCTVRGNMEQCSKTECQHHENWYAMQLMAEVERMKDKEQRSRRQLEAEVKRLKDDATCELCDAPTDAHAPAVCVGCYNQLGAKIERLRGAIRTAMDDLGAALEEDSDASQS